MVNAEKTRQIGLVLPSSYVGKYQSEPSTTGSEIPKLILPASCTEAPQQLTARIVVVERGLEFPSELDTDTLEPSLPPAPFRSTETQQRYQEWMDLKRRLGITACDICKLVEAQDIRGGKLGKAALKLLNLGFVIVPNEFPYDVADGQKVLKHDLFVPIKHYSELDIVHLLTDIAFIKLLRRAKKEHGYDVTSERSPTNAASSVPGHKHVHLYKLGPKMKRFVYDPETGERHVEFYDE